MRYFRTDNNKIREVKIPNKWKSQNGRWTDFKKQPLSVLVQEGFYPYRKPTYDKKTQALGAFKFDQAKNEVYSEVKDRAETLAEVRAEKLSNIRSIVAAMLEIINRYHSELILTGGAFTTDQQEIIGDFFTDVTAWCTHINGETDRKRLMKWDPKEADIKAHQTKFKTIPPY